MIRFASEDIGLADPQALSIVLDALKAYETIGSPEGELCIYQAVAYLSNAPKSNSIYLSEKKLKSLVKQTGQLNVPKHIRNPVTRLMKELDYGKNYQYDHDSHFHYTGQDFLPNELLNQSFYEPGDLGYEKEIKKRMEFFARLKKEYNG